MGREKGRERGEWAWGVGAPSASFSFCLKFCSSFFSILRRLMFDSLIFSTWRHASAKVRSGGMWVGSGQVVCGWARLWSGGVWVG